MLVNRSSNMKNSIALLLVIVCSFYIRANGQTNARPNIQSFPSNPVSDEAYEAVLDLVFPYEIKDRKKTLLAVGTSV